MSHALPAPDDGRGLVVFLRGLTLDKSSWLPWAEHFNDNGYESASLPWPGQMQVGGVGESTRPVRYDAVRLGHLVSHAEEMLTALPRRPIAIGHGVGGLVVEALLNRGMLAAGVAIAPAPLDAAPSVQASLRAYRRLRCHLRCARRQEGFSRALFHQWYASETPRAGSDQLYDRYLAPVRVRGILRDAARQPPPSGPGQRSPLLLLSGGRDRIAPEASISAHAWRLRKRYPDDATDQFVFPTRSHALVIDEGWPDVANHCLDWLASRDL